MQMQIELLRKRAEEKYSKDHIKHAAYLILEIIKTTPSLSVLKDIDKLTNKLEDLLSKDSKRSKESLNDHFNHLIPFIKDTLSCKEIDSHVIFLASISYLSEHISGISYKIILKEILSRNLHKSEVHFTNEFFTGREKEIHLIKSALSRNERNSVILVGDSGVGKTYLAKKVLSQITDKKVYEIFSGTDNVQDLIASFNLEVGTDNLFFMDELFSFNLEDIKYALRNTTFLACANVSSYKKFESENPDLLSKIEFLNIEELDLKKCASIINKKLENSDLIVNKDFIDELLDLSKRYITKPSFPAKAILVLEECMYSAGEVGSKNLDANLLRSVISQKTDIPLDSLTELDQKDLLMLPERLAKNVKGQKEAIDKVSKVIQRAKIGFKTNDKPIGSFLFVGPSGVGKTELAKALALEIFGDKDAMVRIDMSEYAEAHTVQRLIGAPPGYIGYEEGGQLTNPVKEKPYNLVLLDEIEKAHPRIFDIFLQVLDDGRLTDGRGEVVDFKNTIIIATSNAGIEDILDMMEENKTQSEIVKELKEVLQDYFRIEFINRFNDIIIFNPLREDALEEIAKLQIEKLKIQLKKQNIDIVVSDDSLKLLSKSAYDPRYGARGLIRIVQEQIENKLAQMLLKGKLTQGSRIEF